MQRPLEERSRHTWSGSHQSGDISLRICVVGAEGGDDYARVLSNFDALAYVYDFDLQKAKEFGDRYGVPYYTSLEEILKSRPDGIIIATPAYTHLSLVSSMIEYCKNILVARPLGGSFRECKDIAAMVEKGKIMLIPGYLARFNPIVKRVKEVIDSRRYGSLLMLELQSGSIGRMVNSSLMYDVTIDDVDTALYMLTQPDVVFALNSMNDKAIAITLGFKDSVSCITSNSIGRFRRMNVIMENSMVRCDLIRQEMYVEGEDTVIKESVDPLVLALSNFIDVIDGKDKPRIDIRDALMTEKVVDASLLSSRLGSQVYIHES
ncbi:MAG: Gfo/Idh/MocA family protein [Candidatus Nitrosocaldus sp.]